MQKSANTPSKMKLLAITTLVVLFGGIGIFNAQDTYWSINQRSAKGEKIKGVCWEAIRDSIRSHHIQSLEEHHVNWSSHTPFGYQQDYNQPEIRFSADRGMWGERDLGLVHSARMMREKGIKSMLKPHIWMGASTRSVGKWRSDIEMDSEEEWAEWFANYEQFMLAYAEIAEEGKFEALCIGTELYITTTQHEEEWRQMIAKIREVYTGKLTYAANFYKEYEEIQFWDALDYIGVQAYFPLVEKDSPSLKELQEGWKPHYKSLKQLSKKWKKPVVFTEVGYRSSKDAGIKPWEWEHGREGTEEEICTETQALCYEAMLETFWKEEWLGGIFFWKWTPDIYRKEDENRQRRRRRNNPLSFTPKEQAREVIKEWYAK